MTWTPDLTKLNKYSGLALNETADSVRIRRATNVVMSIIKTAFYATTDNKPVDEVAELLTEAVAYQLLYFEDTGDMTGVGDKFSGGSIGNVSLPSKLDKSGDTSDSRVSPEAADLLFSSHLFTWAPSY